mmetsp:Transcript_113246/g.275074  ORF Transcript_113246/g.275074 Transcript_113246/m.275074 type:complete len:110 (-) Transcript_113246:1031-1360(-)
MISAKAPPASDMSSEKDPCCSTCPVFDMTAIKSHCRINARLWVTTSVVGRSARGASSALATAAAVAESSAEVGSSSTSTGAPRASARAAATRWRSPPESSWPPGPTAAS